MNYIYIILFSFLSLLSQPNRVEEEWKLVKNSNGICVYTRSIEDSNLKEIKLKTNSRSTLSSIISLINDKNNYPQWVYRCKAAYQLKSISEQEYYHYQETSSPWPAQNRDFIILSKVSQNKENKIVTISLNAQPSFISEKDDIVRVKVIKASWTFTPKIDGTTDMEYMLRCDPGGDVPAWIINLGIAEGPYETTYNMLEQLKNDKYKYATLSYIKN